MVATLVRRALAGAKSLLALIGAVSVGGLLLLPLNLDGLSKLPAFATEAFFEPATVVAGPIQARLETPIEREQRAVTEYIAKRYRVSEGAVAGYVAAAYRAGEQHSVDPLLILAVMAVESRYNPVAESIVGAKGLMQVMPKYHLDKLMDHGGEHALLEPEVNIQVGTQILREYQRRFRDTETALQVYAGAFDEPSSQYANKVFAERARLEVLRQKAKKQPQSA
jgi:soluble lytic murein transglycosylase-like protein